VVVSGSGKGSGTGSVTFGGLGGGAGFAAQGGAGGFGIDLAPREVAAVGKNTFRIVLTQGLNRQIRRMCRHFGYTVRRLQRVRIMHLRLGRLGPGEWRALRTDEIAPLLATRADPGTRAAAAVVRPARPTLRLRARRS